MLRFTGLHSGSLILASVFASGCLIGETGGLGDGEEEDQFEEPGVDLSGRICNMSMTVNGSFTQSMAPPVHDDGTPYTGCWPIGTWTFTATTGSSDCQSKPSPLAQYQFRVEHHLDTDGNPYQTNHYMTDPSVRHKIKVSQGGGGLCSGELNLFSTDGKEVWILKPALYADGHLGGDGEYTLYKSDQWIGDP